MTRQTLGDRVWLWGMKVNALQETRDYCPLGFDQSTLTVEQAIQRTGIKNVIMAGNLPIDQASLDAMPSAERVICKTAFHGNVDGEMTVNWEACCEKLLAAKDLAESDPRIEGFHLDDFSTGDTIVTNIRHIEALTNAQSALDDVMRGIDNAISGDLLAQDIRMALHHLGEITGQITTDDLLGNIFSKFCIGK